MPAATKQLATATNLGIHLSRPIIVVDGEPEGVIEARAGTLASEGDNLWRKTQGYSKVGWVLLAAGVVASPLVREVVLTNRVKATFVGQAGDVTAASASLGTIDITVNNDACLKTLEIYGDLTHLDTNGNFKIYLHDDQLGTVDTDVQLPGMFVTSKNGTAAPTEPFPWVQVSGGKLIGFDGTTMTFFFEGLTAAISFVITLTF